MAPRITHHPLEERLPPAPKGRVLLVVEDAEDLHYYCAMLQGQGYLVRTCESFAEGARCLDSEVFDFIVVSQGSPNFEGRAVLERAMEIDRNLPVLIVACCLDMRCYLDAMQLGAVDYLAEPFAKSEMTGAVAAHWQFYRAAA
jgi:DNA-binding NtrC family response regulator